MKKKDIALKVITIDELCEIQGINQTEKESEYDGVTLSVTAWHPGEDFMIDEHVTEHFPELYEELGLEEVCEGDMLYSGDMSADEMKEALTNLGFSIV